MMKYFLIFITLFTSGCCVFTSQDCGCDASTTDVELDAEAVKWIAPYQQENFFLFRNSGGIVDTCLIDRVSDTDYYGGDECGSDYKTETMTLTSSLNPALRFVIKATFIKEVWLFSRRNSDDQISVLIDAKAGLPHTQNIGIVLTDIADYTWNGQNISVLEIRCNGMSACSSFEATCLIVSKDNGLLEYVTQDGTTWTRI
ncbi:MAG: hypothetical protein IT269_06175 [Saprospiraceae bacterium]|nr:hypothetical protein [Saprospiraceae bacterium]